MIVFYNFNQKKKLEWSQIRSFYIVVFAIILMQFIICNMICHEWQLVWTFYTVELSFIFDRIDNMRGNTTWIISSQTDRVFIYISTVPASITQFVTHGTVWGIASWHGSVMEIHWGIPSWVTHDGMPQYNSITRGFWKW